MCNCKGGSVLHWILKILVVVGGINWGLVGVGMLLGMNLNVVELLLGKLPMVSEVVYILVGIAAIVELFTCNCKKCPVDAPAAPAPQA